MDGLRADISKLGLTIMKQKRYAFDRDLINSIALTTV
jgi:hypothetical protein